MPTSVAILACDNKVDKHAFGGIGRVLPQVIHVDVDLPEEKEQFKSRETIRHSQVCIVIQRYERYQLGRRLTSFSLGLGNCDLRAVSM